ncbi:chemotaxis protein CheY [Microbacterium marmarense]|uniref:Chemotaxis protein CheY n=1 Tax=Microbacterium marmarense TaxID=3122051 RepID=A0ABU8LV02_9MICO
MPPPGALQLRWKRVPPTKTRRDVAWSLIRELVGGGILISNPCAHCGRPHGAVQLSAPGMHASVSYAGDYAVVAVATGPFAGFAIDAELGESAVRDDAGLAGVLRRGAAATIREWVRVEAALKADGRGLRVDPTRVLVEALSPHQWRAHVPDGAPISGWDVDDGPDGVVLSAAYAFSAAMPEAPAVPATV